MDKIITPILDSPVKACAVSLTAVSLSYFAIKGIRGILFDPPRSHSYPPGPPREPLIGTLRSFPKGQFVRCWCDWAKTYGEIVYAPIPGNSIVILNSYDIAQEFLAKRPSSTAGRKVGYLVNNLIGWNWSPVLAQPGPRHSNIRKYLRRAIGPQRIGSHDPLLESETAKFMLTLSTFQGNPDDVLQDWVGHLVSKATYGEQIWKEMGQGLSHWNADILVIINEALFSFWLVDVFHFLRFIPDWVPGLRFKELIRDGHDLAEKIRYRPYRKGLALHKSGTLGHSILNDLLEEFGDDDDVRDAVAILYAAGADTTTAGTIQFLHVLFLFPEIAQKVFEEIQTVTHGQRLPKVADRANLPYTEAVWREAIRWEPVMPLGVPHVNEQDEVIRGYFIPKGTMIHQNTKMMLSDPKVWGDPDVFRPERWLEPDASKLPNPLTTLFGWGMRICPGMYFADRVAFHMVTTIISLYNVEPLEGQKIPDPTTIEYSPKAVQQPLGFKCRFVIRDERAENLLKSIWLGE
ncbi:cytochrome P450 [Serendipita vermifera]|nr:cytochrome P450 [Serendipita vermifera]